MTDTSTKETLKRVLIVSKIDVLEIERMLEKNGFEIVGSDPDFVVCYGGDGTILFAERTFPQTPKLIIKRSNVCRGCDYTVHDIENVSDKIKNREFTVRSVMKLETEFKNRRLIGLNEIQVHIKLPIYAIRFSVTAGNKKFNNLIGDGIVVATPFGSTGYYKSTGGKPFEKGIGVSFNNLHNRKIESFVSSEDSTVTVEIDRGPAWVIADNNENFIELTDRDVVTVRKSESVANLICILQ